MSEQEKQAKEIGESKNVKKEKKKGGCIVPIVLGILAFALFFYLFLGIFVVQPIGAVPDGKTIIYWRSGTDLPFITSPDGWLIDNDIDVSLFGRMSAMASLAKELDGRTIVRLPYMKFLYLESTGGKEFVK